MLRFTKFARLRTSSCAFGRWMASEAPRTSEVSRLALGGLWGISRAQEMHLAKYNDQEYQAYKAEHKNQDAASSAPWVCASLAYSSLWWWAPRFRGSLRDRFVAPSLIFYIARVMGCRKRNAGRLDRDDLV